MRARFEIRRRSVLSIVLFAAVLCACTPGGARHKAAAASEADVPAPAADSLCLRDPQRAAGRVAALIGQCAGADERTARARLGELLAEAARDSVSFALVTDLLERCLDDPNSPLRNESCYILYLEELLRMPGLSETDRLGPACRLELARRNRPGTVAADFAYLDRSGRRCTLRDAAAGGRLLLIFYDPACSHCSQMLREAAESPVILRRIERRELAVLAVYTEGDRRLWKATKGAMPAGWEVGFDLDRIVEREVYSVPAMPVMYLLDRGGTVLLKDAFLPEIEARLIDCHDEDNDGEND